MTQRDMEQLLEVNVALTAERDREKFLTMVLDAAMAAARCDGGTLYLLEGDALRFARMTTLSLGIRQGGHGDPIALPPVPMEPRYVCAWAALRGETVSIPDVRESGKYDFSGTEQYDRITGYRTESMLVVPMTGDKGGTIGVLQLINAMDGGRTVPFPAEIVQPISALASQAAACIQNMRYAGQVTALLDSLVDALTAAIDDRTPYNANHSRNMARCAERFLAWAGRNDPAWRRTEDEVRAFVLSVRLHDVGKLVTPLSVMNKEERLGGPAAPDGGTVPAHGPAGPDCRPGGPDHGGTAPEADPGARGSDGADPADEQRGVSFPGGRAVGGGAGRADIPGRERRGRTGAHAG